MFDVTIHDFLAIAGSEDGQLVFWDMRKPEDVLSIFYKAQTDDIMSVAMSDANFVFSGSEDLSIAVFKMTEKNEEDALEFLASPGEAARRIFPLQDDHFGYESSANTVGIYNVDSGIRTNFHSYQNTVK